MAQSDHQNQEEDEGGDGETESFSLTHLPYAPSSEVVDSTTTVDPSYIIHLIRQLVPSPIQRASGTGDSAHASALLNCSNRFPFECANEESNKSQKLQFDSGDDTTVSHSMVNNSKCSEQIEDCVEDSRDSNGSTSVDLWEETGCILWDLSTDKSHAELMVDNFLLNVILANLSLPNSVRKTEICLGILANLACHEVPRNFMISTRGLIDAVIEQLFTIDSPCLYEAFRLLTSVLQNDGAVSWVQALASTHILQQILSVAGNTLNPKLLEKSIELILSIVDSEQVADGLLPSLMHLGLPSLLVDLLESEIMQISTGSAYGRDNILDMVLRACEGLSLVDDYTSVLFSDKKVFHYACALVKHADKDEISSSCVTAVVLVANLISDEPTLAEEISKDFLFMNGLLDTLSFLLDDPEASNAFWSLLARLFIRVPELMNPSSSTETAHYVTLLVEKSVLIAEALENHVEDANEDSSKNNSTAKVASLQGIIILLESYVSEYFQGQQVPEDVAKAHKLFKDSYERQRSCG